MFIGFTARVLLTWSEQRRNPLEVLGNGMDWATYNHRAYA